MLPGYSERHSKADAEANGELCNVETLLKEYIIYFVSQPTRILSGRSIKNSTTHTRVRNALNPTRRTPLAPPTMVKASSGTDLFWASRGRPASEPQVCLP